MHSLGTSFSRLSPRSRKQGQRCLQHYRRALLPETPRHEPIQSPCRQEEEDTEDGDVGNPATATIATLILKGRATSNIAAASFGIEANGFGSIQNGGVTYQDGDPGINFATGFRTDPIGSPLIRVVV
jgi:hypothetical protein